MYAHTHIYTMYSVLLIFIPYSWLGLKYLGLSFTGRLGEGVRWMAAPSNRERERDHRDGNRMNYIDGYIRAPRHSASLDLLDPSFRGFKHANPFASKLELSLSLRRSTILTTTAF